MKLNIKLKILTPIVSILFFIAFFVSIYFPAQIKKQVTIALEDKILTMGEIFGASIENALSQSRYKEVLALNNKVKKTKGLSKIVVLDEEKGELYIYPKDYKLDKDLLRNLDKEQIFEESNVLFNTISLKNKSDIIGYLILGLSLKERNAQISSSRKSIIICSLILLIVFIVVIFYLIQKIVTPIVDVSKSLEEIAQGEGDLGKKLKIISSDEVGELSKQFNTFLRKIKDIISKVKDTTIKVNNLAGEISNSVNEQSGIANEQSSAVAEITSTMEELSVSSTQIADHSNSVVDISSEALDNTEKGAEAGEEVMSKMDEIKMANQDSINEIIELGNKSKEISKVMEIIDNIADQTKLIAFNAAIEASSAGEAGKRFGVVAGEIRRLADNVMESTDEIAGKMKEIQGAINRLVISSEKSSEMIEDGLDSTLKTVNILKEILAGAKSTSDAAKQISLSTQQQKTANSQVVISLKEIANGTDHSSESVQQTSDISINLTNLSNNLKELVGKFKLGENGNNN